MKKSKIWQFSALAAALMLTAASCSKSDDGGNPTPEPGPGQTESPYTDIRGSIKSDMKLTKDKIYRLRGYVYVESGATLDIEAGTTIVSNNDSAGVLIVYKGATINAKGTASDPIVFTSAEKNPVPGDLGGVVIAGKATGNGNHAVIEGGVDETHKNFGGTDDHDNSGVLSYVRIEYAGKAVNPNDEINGLSLYAVGDGTQIDHVQVVRGLDDGFEFFGGTVNCSHLIAYNCADDDFDMDDGYRGHIQFAVSVKDPAFTDAKPDGDLSNNFEVDNTNGKALGFNTNPMTRPVLSNFTAIGPNNAANTSEDYGYNMRLRRGSSVTLANSIVLGGQKGGLIVEDDVTQNNFKKGDARFYNSVLNAVSHPYLALGATSIFEDQDIFDLTFSETSLGGSTLLETADAAGLTDPFNNAAPKLQPKAGTIALSTKGKFDVNGLDNAFFKPTTYIGAFDGTNDWTAGWAVWGK